MTATNFYPLRRALKEILNNCIIPYIQERRNSMKNRIKINLIFCVFLTLLFVPSEKAFNCFAQNAQPEQQDESKGFESVTRNYVIQRPKGNKPAPISRSRQPKAPAKSKRPIYRRISQPSRKPVAEKTEIGAVGFTIWKLAPDTTNESKGVGESQRNKPQTSQTEYARVGSETPLSVGEEIQISIESLSHKGYLYIIDREQYIDGTYSNPKVIFPIRGANNYVVPGRQISTGIFDILPPKLGKKQIAEVFTVIVSPKPLIPGDQLQEGFLDIEPEKFNDWIKKWKVEVTVDEQEDGAGKLMTADESKGIGEGRILTQDDPLPQTVYQGNIKPGNPLLADVKVKFKSAP